MGDNQDTDYNRVIYFDGICILCNKLARFISKNDKKEIFKFAHVQESSSIVYRVDGNTYYESTAIIKISKHLKFPYNLIWFTIVIPKPFRDFIYKWVARNRYKWFGQYDSCEIPSEKEIKRFID